ncbi:MAG: sulfotransferase [Nitrospirota bacterium]|nr:sulfotransferase [Nitrospirota bacterium]
MSPSQRPTSPNPDAAPTASPDGKIRVLRHMARAGGTVVSKCLAVMPGVALLSEIHPYAIRMFNPLIQAREWFNLYTQEEIDALSAGNPTFNTAIADIDRRARAAGRTLVIREWSHLDYLGVPFLPVPPYRPVMLDSLAGEFTVIQATTVRHPIDQWISTARLAIMQSGGLNLGSFLEGYRRFAEDALPHGIVRYEDFATDPDTHLKILCERLHLTFDPGYRERWFSYTHVTGDVHRPDARPEIKIPRRQEVDADFLRTFERNPDYRAVLKLLGYGHPS